MSVQAVGDDRIIEAGLQGDGGAGAGEVDSFSAGCSRLSVNGHGPPHLTAPPSVALTQKQTR